MGYNTTLLFVTLQRTLLTAACTRGAALAWWGAWMSHVLDTPTTWMCLDTVPWLTVIELFD